MSGTEKWNRVPELFGRVSGTRFLCPALANCFFLMYMSMYLPSFLLAIFAPCLPLFSHSSSYFSLFLVLAVFPVFWLFYFFIRKVNGWLKMRFLEKILYFVLVAEISVYRSLLSQILLATRPTIHQFFKFFYAKWVPPPQPWILIFFIA